MSNIETSFNQLYQNYKEIEKTLSNLDKKCTELDLKNQMSIKANEKTDKELLSVLEKVDKLKESIVILKTELEKLSSTVSSSMETNKNYYNQLVKTSEVLEEKKESINDIQIQINKHIGIFNRFIKEFRRIDTTLISMDDRLKNIESKVLAGSAVYKTFIQIAIAIIAIAGFALTIKQLIFQ